MPTYTCTAAAGLLDAARKAALARAVTRAHFEVTGAPAYFAQVVFQDVAPGDHFIGGVPLGHDHVFVYGRIRGGRSADVREALIRRLVADVAAAAGIEPFGVWVYLLELPPAQARILQEVERRAITPMYRQKVDAGAAVFEKRGRIIEAARGNGVPWNRPAEQPKGQPQRLRREANDERAVVEHVE